ncbi:MAG: hypothetical protein GY711_07870 [bacterium]|nr:hypothetical protein [bacterium]
MELKHIDEEAKALIRQILRSHGYRLLAIADIRGHGMKFLPGLDEKRRCVEEMRFDQTVLREMDRVYRAIDGDDLPTDVLEKIERVTYPESRLELAACLAFTGRAAVVAARSFVDSASGELAAIARTVLDAPCDAREEEERLFVEFSKEETHRPQAEQYWSRWIAASILSFGRPGTSGDRRVVELGLRSKSSSDVVRDFLDEVEPLRTASELRLPPLTGFGVELPEDLRVRFATGGL